MEKQLESLAIELCEFLPLGITIFEKNGECQKAPNNCEYCEKKNKDNYFCSKETYTFFPKLNIA